VQTDEQYIRSLLINYVHNNLTQQQTAELFDYLSLHPLQTGRLLKEIAELVDITMAGARPPEEEVSQRMLRGLLTKIGSAAVVNAGKRQPSQWKRWAIAASIVLLAGAAVYFYTGRQPKSFVSRIAANPQHTEKDALPGSDGAILTTAAGEQIKLDSTIDGIVTREGNTAVIKKDNQLVYNEAAAVRPATEIFNTLSTQKGRKFQLVLADGTKVWLDAASSLTYPIVFTGSQRNVKATGQLYFEVAKDPAKPFIVETGGTKVQVLGTHFNVNAYEDESAVKTTLLEGMIRITTYNNSSLLTPGQQAVINNSESGAIKINNAVDVEAVMAWKNGLFQFTNANLTTVLRQLSRWYDMDIVYEGKMPEREFEGKIGRDLNLSQVLKILEKVQVKFRIEGSKLIVQP
jgi:hypothetical protein